jgi:hypothetical protein
MFDDIKDRIARLSVARLQKRIDTLKAQQEMLNKFTEQRNLNELAGCGKIVVRQQFPG